MKFKIDEIISNYSHKFITIEWPIPEIFKQTKEVTNRDLMAEHLLKMDASAIVQYYAYHTFEEMEEWLAFFENYVKLKGVGLELGAGCGVMSAVFAKHKDVDCILAVEVVETMAKKVLPKVAEGYLKNNKQKVIPVLGTFDDLQIPDESIDFIIEMDSLHHSHNLEFTFKESFRVLKKGGKMIFLDRCHPDSLSDNEVNNMLDVVYKEDWIKHNFYPEGSVLTRRDNGENEYRVFEWMRAINGAGFKLNILGKCHRKISFIAALKNLIGFTRDTIFGKTFNKNGATLHEWNIWLAQTFGINAKNKDGFQILKKSDVGNHSLFVLEKP